MDLRKAYDSVDRGDLWGTLAQQCQVPPGLLQALQQLYHQLRAEIVGGGDRGPVNVLAGLKQGCPCSPLLFSLLFDRVEAAV